MADKNNTSSLLEAIKNKLSKFDNKPKPENTKPPVNYFSQDSKNSELDKASIDKTNIGLIFETEKKLENIRKKNLNQNINKQKDIDLDLDDESLNVKNLGQKISIESKIKEIADELNLEEFEDDFEYDDTQENSKDDIEENNDETYKDLDPIDIELMELEKEVAKNNQQKIQNNSDAQIAEDLNLKSYLDAQFEDEIGKIEEEIKNEKINSNADVKNAENTSSLNQKIEDIELPKKSNPLDLNSLPQNQFSFKLTPAQEFLASVENKTLDQESNLVEEDLVEEDLVEEDLVEEDAKEEVNEEEKIIEENQVQNKVVEEKVIEENVVKNKVVEEKVIEENVVKNEVAEEKVIEENQVQNKVEQNVNKSLPNQVYQDLPKQEKIIENLNIAQNFIAQKPIEPISKLEDLNKINYPQNFEKNFSQKEFFVEKDLKLNEENIDKNNAILEKINYNLIHEETIYQASNSMKKLMEAKNLVNNIGNFARDETLTKIAINLMEPKLEKWLNDNLPLMVENIVREEIEKIVPKA